MCAPMKLDSLDAGMEGGLAVWRAKQMQLEAAGVAAAEAAQSEPSVGSVLGEGVEAEEEVRGEGLSPVLHEAWEARRLRALNDVLGVELQPGSWSGEWRGVRWCGGGEA